MTVSGPDSPQLRTRLAAGNEALQCAKRFLDAGFNALLEDFINAELARGTNPGILCAALAETTAAGPSSIIEQLLAPEHRAEAAAKTVAIYRATFDRMLAEHGGAAS